MPFFCAVELGLLGTICYERYLLWAVFVLERADSVQRQAATASEQIYVLGSEALSRATVMWLLLASGSGCGRVEDQKKVDVDAARASGCKILASRGNREQAWPWLPEHHGRAANRRKTQKQA